MRKRKINQQYLSRITAQETKDDEISAVDFAKSLKRFADEYLRGIIEFNVTGESAGSVSLKLEVTSYLIRLLCECGDNDDMITAELSLDDDLVLSVTYEGACPAEDVVKIFQVARLAGFKIDRNQNTLIFKAPIKRGSILQVYATSAGDFFDTLVITHKM